MKQQGAQRGFAILLDPLDRQLEIGRNRLLDRLSARVEFIISRCSPVVLTISMVMPDAPSSHRTDPARQRIRNHGAAPASAGLGHLEITAGVERRPFILIPVSAYPAIYGMMFGRRDASSNEVGLRPAGDHPMSPNAAATRQ